jgi:hypothetical protein
VLVLTPLAWLAPRVDALFPKLTSAVLSLTVRLLPDASRPTPPEDTVEGWQAASSMTERGRQLVNRLTTLGRRAADRNLEEPARGRTSEVTR